MISFQIVPVSQQLVRARTYKVCKVKPDTGGQSRIGRVQHFVLLHAIPSFTLQVISNLNNSNRTLNITKKKNSSSYIALFKMPKEKTIICWWRFMRYMSQISDRREVSASRISEYLINWIFCSVLGSLTAIPMLLHLSLRNIFPSINSTQLWLCCCANLVQLPRQGVWRFLR